MNNVFGVILIIVIFILTMIGFYIMVNMDKNNTNVNNMKLKQAELVREALPLKQMFFIEEEDERLKLRDAPRLKQITQVNNRVVKVDENPPTSPLFSTVTTPVTSVPDYQGCNYVLSTLPTSFDANQYWGFMITPPADQGTCNSCWAFSVSTTLSDRYRIFSKNILLNNVNLSPCELVAKSSLQCNNLGQCNQGCSGEGSIPITLNYLLTNSIYSMSCLFDKLAGIVGTFGFSAKQLIVDGQEITIDCSTICTTGNQTSCYTNNVANCINYSISTYYNLTYNPNFSNPPFPQYNLNNTQTADLTNINITVSQIQNDLYNYGPVMASYTIYQSFIDFFSGAGTTRIYLQQSQNDTILGGHATVIVGWGVEADGTPYWLCRNTWGVGWNPAMLGYFKILRGYNFCGIEQDAWGCLPKPVDGVTFTNIQNFVSTYNNCLPSQSTLSV
jgi:C1A family cysteine protease